MAADRPHSFAIIADGLGVHAERTFTIRPTREGLSTVVSHETQVGLLPWLGRALLARRLHAANQAMFADLAHAAGQGSTTRSVDTTRAPGDDGTRRSSAEYGHCVWSEVGLQIKINRLRNSAKAKPRDVTTVASCLICCWRWSQRRGSFSTTGRIQRFEILALRQQVAVLKRKCARPNVESPRSRVLDSAAAGCGFDGRTP
jgi:hypothetical protein